MMTEEDTAMIRDDDDVRSLWHELRTRLHEDYRWDIQRFNIRWCQLVREVLRTEHLGSKRKALMAAEHAVTVCVGLVYANTSEAVSLFRLPQVQAWIDEARETGEIPPGLDKPTAKVLSRMGYSIMRSGGNG